jgi:hypothetical protein
VSTRSDPLGVRLVSGPNRLYYAQGVLLDAQDFGDEQNYHRGRLARALQYLFGTGTVAGLSVTFDSETEEVVIAPGLALDPLGRMIEVPRRCCLRLREWYRAQREQDLQGGWIDESGTPLLIADVFVRFVVCENGKTPAFAAGPFDALDAVQPSRLRDAFEFALVIRDEAGVRRQALLDGDPTPPAIPVPDARQRLLGLPADPAARLTAIEDLIFSAYREGTGDWQNDRPPRLIEHLGPRVLVPTGPGVQTIDPTEVGRDPTSVLLARLAIEIDSTPVVPTLVGFTPSASNPDNRIRRFIYESGYLTRPANRGAP